MRRGLFPIWAQCAQDGPVFEYARSGAHTGRPLEMAGYNNPFSAAGPSRWCEARITFFDKANSSPPPADLRTSLRRDLRIPFAADPDRGYSIFFRFPTAVDNMPGMMDNITGTADKIAEFHGSDPVGAQPAYLCAGQSSIDVCVSAHVAPPELGHKIRVAIL